MLEASSNIYSKLRNALNQCCKLVDLKFLCLEIGIKPDAIVIKDQTFDEAAFALLEECKYEDKIDALVQAITKLRPHCREVKELRDAYINRGGPPTARRKNGT